MPQNRLRGWALVGIILGIILMGSNLSRTTSSVASVELAWDNDDPSVTTVNIYRGSVCITVPDQNSLLVTLRTPTNRYIDTTAISGTTYTYSVFAIAADGSYSDPSCITYTPSVQASGSSNTTSTTGTTMGSTPSTSSTSVSDAIVLLVLQNKNLFLQAEAAGIALPRNILNIIHGQTNVYVPSVVSLTPSASGAYYRDLSVGSSGDDVSMLQRFLIAQNKGPEARALARNGVTGYFGNLTKYALAEYQYAVGIVPSSGNFGPATRARIQQ